MSLRVLGDFEVCPNPDFECGHLGADHSGGVDSPVVCSQCGCEMTDVPDPVT